MKQVYKALRIARERIRKFGHVKGEYGNSRIGYCTTGSIYHVRDYRLLKKIVGALRDAAGCDNIVHWNDKPTRTKKEVIDLFTKAMRATR